jgi:hypothetical protein
MSWVSRDSSAAIRSSSNRVAMARAQGCSAQPTRAGPRQSVSASPYRRAWTKSSNRNASTETRGTSSR